MKFLINSTMTIEPIINTFGNEQAHVIVSTCFMEAMANIYEDIGDEDTSYDLFEELGQFQGDVIGDVVDRRIAEYGVADEGLLEDLYDEHFDSLSGECAYMTGHLQQEISDSRLVDTMRDTSLTLTTAHTVIEDGLATIIVEFTKHEKDNT